MKTTTNGWQIGTMTDGAWKTTVDRLFKTLDSAKRARAKVELETGQAQQIRWV